MPSIFEQSLAWLGRAAVCAQLGALGWAADFADLVRTGEQCVAAGKTAQVKDLLAQIASQPDGPTYTRLFTACMQMAGKKPAEAAKTLATAFPTDAAVQGLTPRLQLAYADTLRRCQRAAEATAVADRLGQTSEGLDRARAARLMSDVFADRQRWAEALEWITVAVKTAEAATAQYDADRAYTKTLCARKAEIEQLIEVSVHGLGFRLYRIGNEQRFAGKHAEAIATYDRLLALYKRNADKPVVPLTGMDDPHLEDLPIHPLYAAAAQVYRGESLLRLERFRDARDGLLPVSTDPTHPYQGEALRVLGDIALEESGDIKAAERSYTSALDALGRADAQARTLDRFRVPDVSRVKIQPPAAMRSYVGWGNLEWYHPEPQQVINAETCDWYTSYQTMEAQIKRSLCYFVLGKTEEAVRDLGIINLVDTQDRALTESSMPSNYLRLRDGYRAGHLYASAPEMAEFTGKTLVRFIQAEVLFETEQWDAALAAYGRLADNGARLSLGAKAYLAYAQASALVFAGKPAAAKRFIDGFLGDKPAFAKTPTYWRSLFLLANLDTTNEVALLRKGATACPDPSLRLDFVLRLGQLAYTRQQDTEAIAYFTTLSTTTSATDYRKKSAENYLARIRARVSDAASPPSR